MNIHYLFYLFLTGLLSFYVPLQELVAQEDSGIIFVNLATEPPLMPLYLAPFQREQTDLTESYLKKLEDVLAFDLNYNGTTSLSKRTPELNYLALSDDFNLKDWKDYSIFYVIKGRITGQALSVWMLSVNGQAVKKVESLPLSGDFAKDRHQMHQLADAIHKSLFGTEGIASTHILYSFKTALPNGKNQSEIWECDYDGANPHPITHENSDAISPFYIPAKVGHTPGGFLYVSYQIGQPKIYVARLKEGMGRRLTYLKGNQLMPAISAQRDQVAFISDVTGNPDLFIQPFSPEAGALGKPQQVFSARQATQGSPTFSPDGKQLAFVSDKDGSPRIYILEIPAPGTHLDQIKTSLISRKNRENTAPSWSPDGTKIAYCARSQGERQIWIYDLATKQERQLTEGSGHKENPCWASNSLHVVFNSVSSQGSELYLVNLNQPKAIQITSGKGEKRFPNWEPKNSENKNF